MKLLNTEALATRNAIREISLNTHNFTSTRNDETTSLEHTHTQCSLLITWVDMLDGTKFPLMIFEHDLKHWYHDHVWNYKHKR
jgi:hypothetical protein